MAFTSPLPNPPREGEGMIARYLKGSTRSLSAVCCVAKSPTQTRCDSLPLAGRVREGGFLQEAALLFSLLFLSACGFSPIYGGHGADNTPVAQALGNVQIENIPDRNGQMLRNKLIDRMYTHGRPQDPIAHLYVTIASSETGLGVQKDATTTRSQLSMNATYVLKDMDGREVHKGRAHSVASYSKLDAQYGTVASQRNAYERAIGEVSEQIVNAISLYYAEKAPQEKTIRPAAKE